MADGEYNEEEYVKAAGQLEDAIYTLIDNDISRSEIDTLVRDAIENAGA